MKIAPLFLILASGLAAAQPYVSISSGVASVAARGLGGAESERRDQLAAGVILSKFVSVELAAFRIEEARFPFPPPPSGVIPIIPFAVAARQKIDGVVVGAVFSWPFNERWRLVSRHSAALLRTREYVDQFNFSRSYSYRDWRYEPTVGVACAIGRSGRCGMSIEGIYDSSSRATIHSYLASFSYKF